MAGRIPQSFINDLIERVDIVDVIDERVPLKRTGKNLQALCPFHNEKSPSFSVNPEKQFYYCFGCGATGTSLGFLMEYDRLDFVEAVETLARIAGVEVPREAGSRERRVDVGLYDVLEAADAFFRAALRDRTKSQSAVEYLKARGVTGIIARDFAIGYAPAGWDGLKNSLSSFGEQKLIDAGLLVKNDAGRVYDRFRDRVMFPIRDTRGRVIGFGGRVLGDEKPKYLNSPETDVFHKNRELYGLFEARRAVRELTRVIVVEGYMDVVALAQHSVPCAVATLGTATSQAHFEKLFRHTKEVVCCFDGDAAGRGAAWKSLASAFPVLTEGRLLKFVFLPDGDDPDTLIRSDSAQFNRMVESAVSAGDYFFNEIRGDVDLSSIDSRARLAELAVPLIARLPDGLFRSMMIERLSTEAGISAGAIEQRLGIDTSRKPSPVAVPRTESKIGRRLTAYLLDSPGLGLQLDAAVREELIGNQTGQDSLMVAVLRRIVEDQTSDTSTLLAGFIGDPNYPTLKELEGTSPSLTNEALAGEFVDGVGRFLEEREKANYRALVHDLREDGSAESLARYWNARRSRVQDPSLKKPG